MKKHIKIQPHFVLLDTESTAKYYFDPVEEQLYSDTHQPEGYVRQLAKYSAFHPGNQRGEDGWYISHGKKSGYKNRAPRIFITVSDISKFVTKPQTPVLSGSRFSDSDVIELGQIVYYFNDIVWNSYIIEGIVKVQSEGKVPESTMPVKEHGIS